MKQKLNKTPAWSDKAEVHFVSKTSKISLRHAKLLFNMQNVCSKPLPNPGGRTGDEHRLLNQAFKEAGEKVLGFKKKREEWR